MIYEKEEDARSLFKNLEEEFWLRTFCPVTRIMCTDNCKSFSPGFVRCYCNRQWFVEGPRCNNPMVTGEVIVSKSY
jgi:hypothetical protein